MAKKDIESVEGGEFWITNDEGKEVKCEILFTFESDETKKVILYIQIIHWMRIEAQKYMRQSTIQREKNIL